MYFNCRSLIPKFDELATLCSANSPSIICLTETWLCESISSNEILIPNYSVVRLDRHRHGGGVAIYVHNCFAFKVLLKVKVLLYGPSGLELLVLSLSPDNNPNLTMCTGVFIDHHPQPMIFLILFVTASFVFHLPIFLILYSSEILMLIY